MLLFPVNAKGSAATSTFRLNIVSTVEKRMETNIFARKQQQIYARNNLRIVSRNIYITYICKLRKCEIDQNYGRIFPVSLLKKPKGKYSPWARVGAWQYYTSREKMSLAWLSRASLQKISHFDRKTTENLLIVIPPARFGILVLKNQSTRGNKREFVIRSRLQAVKREVKCDTIEFNATAGVSAEENCEKWKEIVPIYLSLRIKQAFPSFRSQKLHLQF